jgi:hypothetical protein
MSFNTSFSRLNSLTNRFSLLFSDSNSFNRRAWSTTYTPAPAVSAGTCTMIWHDATPHINPIFGVTFEPDICAGAAPFAPIQYTQWLASEPGTLYVVRYTPSPTP